MSIVDSPIHIAEALEQFKNISKIKLTDEKCCKTEPRSELKSFMLGCLLSSTILLLVYILITN